jgi:hypothetical protein
LKAAQQLLRQEALKRWFESTGEPEVPQELSPPDIIDVEEDVPEPGYPESFDNGDIDAEAFTSATIAGLKDYTRIISNDPGYVWFLDRLRREIMFSKPADCAMESIRDMILGSIPRANRISRKSSVRGVEVVYSVDWSPAVYLDEQDYAEPGSLAFAKAITLTESFTDAQALSCGDYLRQTWPHTGNGVLKLIERLLSPSFSNQAVCK